MLEKVKQYVRVETDPVGSNDEPPLVLAGFPLPVT